MEVGEQPDWHNGQTKLECLHACALYIWSFIINTTVYHLGQYENSWPSTKKSSLTVLLGISSKYAIKSLEHVSNR